MTFRYPAYTMVKLAIQLLNATVSRYHLHNIRVTKKYHSGRSLKGLFMYYLFLLHNIFDHLYSKRLVTVAWRLRSNIIVHAVQRKITSILSLCTRQRKLGLAIFYHANLSIWRKRSGGPILHSFLVKNIWCFFFCVHGHIVMQWIFKMIHSVSSLQIKICRPHTKIK